MCFYIKRRQPSEQCLNLLTNMVPSEHSPLTCLRMSLSSLELHVRRTPIYLCSWTNSRDFPERYSVGIKRLPIEEGLKHRMAIYKSTLILTIFSRIKASIKAPGLGCFIFSTFSPILLFIKPKFLTYVLMLYPKFQQDWTIFSSPPTAKFLGWLKITFWAEFWFIIMHLPPQLKFEWFLVCLDIIHRWCIL